MGTMGKLNVAVSTILITAMVSTLIGINPASIWSDQQEAFAGLSIENAVSIPEPDNSPQDSGNANDRVPTSETPNTALPHDLKPFEDAAETASSPPVTTQESDPAWLDIEAPLVSPEEAHKVLDKVSEVNTEGFAATETEISTEIAELARGLQYDPELIYLYVHNHIDYVPIYGSIKGATMTLIDGQGNDFDQASLFIALMRTSGYDAHYVYGNVTYPVDVIANWLGVQGEAGPLGQLLGSGGIPGIIWVDGSGNVVEVTMDRVWTVVDIGGTDYVFDPSFKQYDTSPKLDLESILGYNQSTFLSLAEDGTTIDPDYTQGLNETNIRDALTDYSMNLHSNLKTNLPNGSLEDVLGIREIIPEEVMPLETSLPYDSAVLDEWTEIPDSYRHHFRVQHELIDYTFATPEIYGKRLSIFYNYLDEPELRLDGDLVATGWWCYPGYYYPITLTVDHPYAAIGGTYGDQTFTRDILAGGQYVITSNFGGMTEKVIAPRNLLLSENIHAGLGSDSEPVRGETLHIMGLTYHAECGRAGELAGKISDNVIVTHHIVGFVQQTASPSIDIPMGFRSLTSINDNQELEDACYHATAGITSAFEHAMIMQLQDMEAVSTVRLIQLANEAGDKIFDANSSNWEAIKPQLQNYAAYQIDYLEYLIITDGCTITLPQNGALILNEWAGAGFIVHWPSGASGYTIWGGLYYGGSGTEHGDPDTPKVADETDPPKPGDDNLSAEPVNLASGAYIHTHTDLTVGRRGNPNGLAFTRYYNSGGRLGNNTLGYGWDHSYNICLNVSSDGYQGMGADSHFDAVSTVTELYVTVDLMRGSFSHEKTVVATIAHKWFTDQLIDNAVKINSGGQVSEFIRLPDGSYNPPPGITDELVYDAGSDTYSLNRRFGIVLDFNTEGQIETWTDANGNAMQFLYDGDGLLDTVTDAFGRTLTFSYNADKRLESVSDSAGRVIVFSYDGDGNLDAYTDPTGIATYQYSYDSGHRLTEIHAPSGQRLVTNVYDGLDRVTEQTNGRNFTWEFFWSGYRNVEQDPLGNEHVYYFDDRARLVAEMNKCGATTQYTYDSQNHRTSVTDANGHTRQFAYDGNNNLASFISTLSNIIAFSYDGEDRLIAITDPSGNTTSFSYDSYHNLLSITDPLGNTTSYTRDSRGRLELSTDANGYISTFTYDSADNLESATDPLGYTTDYSYDGVGNPISVTDANSNATSFTYDNNRRVTGITDASGNTTTYIYNLDGNLDSRTDGNGDTALCSYDENWNLITITYPAYSVGYTYDEVDNLIQVTDPAGISMYDYDEEGRLISYTDVNGYTVDYSYDPVGNILSITYPGSKTVSYTYDAENGLESVNDWLGGQTDYSYDSRGLLTFATLPNGAKVEYGYDEAGRMIGLSNTDSTDAVIASYSYTLDPNGNILSQTMSQPLMPAPMPESTDYTYGPDNRLISVDGMSFLYDSNGNTIQKGTTTYQYDYENRLVEVIAPSDTWEYTYDGLGNRIGVNHNGDQRWYLVDPRGITQVLAEYDGSGITNYYIYGLGLISMVDAADNRYYYHYDYTGNTVAMTDAGENIVNKYAYTPFGELADIEEAVPNPFRYVGEFGVMDDGNGLLYMRARYYDPEVGRFITKDPIWLAGGVNLYTYVVNNPLMFVDPLGLGKVDLSEVSKDIGEIAFWHYLMVPITFVATGIIAAVFGLPAMTVLSIALWVTGVVGLIQVGIWASNISKQARERGVTAPYEKQLRDMGITY